MQHNSEQQFTKNNKCLIIHKTLKPPAVTHALLPTLTSYLSPQHTHTHTCRDLTHAPSIMELRLAQPVSHRRQQQRSRLRQQQHQHRHHEHCCVVAGVDEAGRHGQAAKANKSLEPSQPRHGGHLALVRHPAAQHPGPLQLVAVLSGSCSGLSDRQSVVVVVSVDA